MDSSSTPPNGDKSRHNRFKKLWNKPKPKDDEQAEEEVEVRPVIPERCVTGNDIYLPDDRPLPDLSNAIKDEDLPVCRPISECTDEHPAVRVSNEEIERSLHMRGRVFHERWTPEEVSVFEAKYKTLVSAKEKKFMYMARALPNKTIGDCIEYYYLFKNTTPFKQAERERKKKEKDRKEKITKSQEPCTTRLRSGRVVSTETATQTTNKGSAPKNTTGNNNKETGTAKVNKTTTVPNVHATKPNLAAPVVNQDVGKAFPTVPNAHEHMPQSIRALLPYFDRVNQVYITAPAQPSLSVPNAHVHVAQSIRSLMPYYDQINQKVYINSSIVSGTTVQPPSTVPVPLAKNKAPVVAPDANAAKPNELPSDTKHDESPEIMAAKALMTLSGLKRRFPFDEPSTSTADAISSPTPRASGKKRKRQMRAEELNGDEPEEETPSKKQKRTHATKETIPPENKAKTNSASRKRKRDDTGADTGSPSQKTAATGSTVKPQEDTGIPMKKTRLGRCIRAPVKMDM